MVVWAKIPGWAQAVTVLALAGQAQSIFAVILAKQSGVPETTSRGSSSSSAFGESALYHGCNWCVDKKAAGTIDNLRLYVLPIVLAYHLTRLWGAWVASKVYAPLRSWRLWLVLLDMLSVVFTMQCLPGREPRSRVTELLKIDSVGYTCLAIGFTVFTSLRRSEGKAESQLALARQQLESTVDSFVLAHEVQSKIIGKYAPNDDIAAAPKISRTRYSQTSRPLCLRSDVEGSTCWIAYKDDR